MRRGNGQLGAQVGTRPTPEPPPSSLGNGLLMAGFRDLKRCWCATVTASYTECICVLIRDDNVLRRGEPIAS